MSKDLLNKANTIVDDHLAKLEADDDDLDTVWEEVLPVDVGEVRKQRYHLREATKKNNLQLIKNIIEKPAIYPSEKTMLMESWIKFGDHIEYLMGLGGELRDPLHIAASNGQPTIVKYLLENGAPVDGQDYGAATPLSLAVIKGLMANKEDSKRYLKTISLLLKKGALVNDIWLPDYDEDPYEPDDFSTGELSRDHLSADAAINIARMSKDRPGENHREKIYYLLNDAYADQHPVALPPPEAPPEAAAPWLYWPAEPPAAPPAAAAAPTSTYMPVLSPSSKKESRKSSSNNYGGGKRKRKKGKQTKRKRKKGKQTKRKR